MLHDTFFFANRRYIHVIHLINQIFNFLLSDSGHCKVDQTEKGWFIQYIDRDPETIERQKVKRG